MRARALTPLSEISAHGHLTKTMHRNKTADSSSESSAAQNVLFVVVLTILVVLIYSGCKHYSYTFVQETLSSPEKAMARMHGVFVAAKNKAKER